MSCAASGASSAVRQDRFAYSSILQQWASVVLCLSEIQFVEAESPEEDRLLEALWDASAGLPIADHDLSLARTLTS
jgi:hypothetical protein